MEMRFYRCVDCGTTFAVEKDVDEEDGVVCPGCAGEPDDRSWIADALVEVPKKSAVD